MFTYIHLATTKLTTKQSNPATKNFIHPPVIVIHDVLSNRKSATQWIRKKL